MKHLVILICTCLVGFCFSQEQDPEISLSHPTQVGSSQTNDDLLIEGFLSPLRAFDTDLARSTTCTYTPTGKISSKTLPNGTILYYYYHPLGYLQTVKSSSGDINQNFSFNLLGEVIFAEEITNNISVRRKLDPFGNILKESFSNGLDIQKEFDSFDRPVTVQCLDKTIYLDYDPLYLRKVKYLNFEHHYDQYDDNGNLIQERNLYTTITHSYDANGKKTEINSPIFSESVSYDSCGNCIQKQQNDALKTYQYDELSQLISEGENTFCYDSQHNRIQKNGQSAKINQLNEILSQGKTTYEYDLNGNLILKKTPESTLQFFYDSLNRLKEVKTNTDHILYTYDPFGRRVSKKNEAIEHYLYDGEQEIGCFANGSWKQFRVLGHPFQTIAVETNRLKTSLQDIQGNVRALLDSKSRKFYDYTAFGECQLDSDNPWGFASKRFDPETSLYYFGKRYYDAELGRWLTTDPLDNIDSNNLYQFALNNPYKYKDPDGQAVFLLPLVFATFGSTFTISLPSLTTIAIASTIAYTGYKLSQMRFIDTTYLDNAAMDLMMSQSIDAQEEEEEETSNDLQSEHNGNEKKDKKFGANKEKEGQRNKFRPNLEAVGDHTNFRRDNIRHNIDKYATFHRQSNPKDPKPWDKVKEFHGSGEGHYNKPLDKKILNPHVHDRKIPGKVRPAEDWEIPK